MNPNTGLSHSNIFKIYHKNHSEGISDLGMCYEIKLSLCAFATLATYLDLAVFLVLLAGNSEPSSVLGATG